MQLLGLLSLAAQASALYFYLEGGSRQCVMEDLSKDVMLVVKYKVEEFQPQHNSYVVNHDMGVTATIDEVFDNYHRVVNSRGKAEGKFTYTTQDTGLHELCFQAAASNGWFTSSRIRLHLDIVSGFSEEFKGKGDEKVHDLGRQVEELNHRLKDVLREQSYQRTREMEFRDQSERTNAKVAWWTLVQLFVILAMCAWQLTHLRGFFTKQKLV
ncbi:emp24p/erv25p-related protein [Savitreella phatthalungensis]